MSEETIAKITITKQAEEAVSQIVSRVNDGFEAGRVNRQDVASWILIRIVEKLSEEDIGQIRMAFFNEITLLEAILRRAKANGEIPQELRSALHGQVDNQPAISKKQKKSLTSKLTNGQHEIREDVA